MGAKSTINGNRGESIAEKALRNKGYWVHITGRSTSGSQPVDIIAIKRNECWLMDAKFVAIGKPSFSFDDVQPNQVASMRYAHDMAKIDNLGFFIVFERDINNPRFMSFDEYLSLVKDGKKSVNMSELNIADEVIR